MIRPFTLITMLLAAGSGAYLFAVKHHAQMLDDQIAEVSQASRLDAQRIRVLQAQWALETDPTRLQTLAAQFTALQPMQPAQLLTLAALKISLPAPGSAPPSGNPELPGLASPELEASAAPLGEAVASALPMPPPQSPVMVASIAPAPKLVRARRRVSHSPLAGSELADNLPQSQPYQAPHSAAFQMVAPVSRAAPMGAEVMSVKASIPAPSYTASPALAANDAGSALGMASSLPPPQPLQAGTSN